VSPGKVGVLPYDLDFPYTHSLTGHFVLGLVTAATYFCYRAFIRPRTRGPALDGTRYILYESFMLGVLVFSHWFMDLPVRRGGAAGDGILLWMSEDNKPSNRYGRGAFDSRWATLIIELLFFLPGWAVYRHVTQPVVRGGRPQPPTLSHLVTALWATHLLLIFAPKAVYDSSIPLMLTVWLSVSLGLAVLAHTVDKNRIPLLDHKQM